MEEVPPQLTVFGLIKSYASEHPVVSSSMAILALAFPIQSVLMPVFIGRLTKDVANKVPKKVILKDLAILAVLNIVAVFLYTIDLIASQAFSVTMMGHIQRQLTNYLLTEKSIGIDAVASTELTVKMRVFATFMSSRINLLRNNFAPGLITITFQMLYLSIMIDWGLGACVGAVLAAVSTMIGISLKKKDERSNVSIRADEASVARVADILCNFTTVIGNAKVVQELEDLTLIHQEAKTKRLQAVRRTLVTTSSINAVCSTSVCVFFWRLYNKFLANGDLNGKNVEIAATASSMVLETLSVSMSLMHHIYELIYGTAGLNVIRGAFTDIACDAKTLAASKCGLENRLILSPERIDARSVAIEIRDVTFSYPGCEDTFTNFNLAIDSGKNIVILGQNGTGKSTLMKMLLRYAVPNEGELFLFGVPYSSLSIREIRRRIAYANQAPTLFNRSIYENIGFAKCSKTNKKEIDDFIESIGLTVYFAESFEHGLETIAGREGKSVSGGQRQMIQLVRILYQNSDIIVLDEVTSAVDVTTKLMITNLLENHFMSKTLILVTHDESVIPLADTVIRFEA